MLLPHCLSLPGKLWSNWNCDSLGTCESSITPGQGLNPLQRSTRGKALGSMHMDADALKTFPMEIFHKASRERGRAQTPPQNCSSINGLPRNLGAFWSSAWCWLEKKKHPALSLQPL